MTRPFNPRWRIHSDKVAALSVALAPVLYFLPAILKGKVLCPDDGIIFYVPLRVAAAQIVRSGNLPLWNPYIFSGMPLLAAAQGGLLFPSNWFYLLFSSAAATNLMVVSTYVIAALGAYLYARRVGVSVNGAMITSLVWQMSGCLVGQIGHISIVQTAAMLPWGLWALESFVGGQGYKRGPLLAVLVAIQIFAGHQQTFVYSLILVAGYAIAMAVTDAQLRKRYLSSLAFVASGVLLSALQIVPTVELLRNSARAEATYVFFSSYSMPRRFVLALFAPYLMGGGDGRLFRAPYVGPPFYLEMVGYAGLLAIMLALVALLIRPDARTKFWGVTAVVCMLLAFGDYAPLKLHRIMYHVPVLNLFRVPARHLMEVDFAIAVLAGRGLTILGAERRNHRVLGRVVIAGALVFLITCLAVTYFRPADFHLARAAAVSVIRAPELFIPVSIAAISAGALWLFARQRRGSTPLIFAVLVLDLVVWGQSSGWYTGSPMNGDDYWGVPETVHILRSVAPQGAGSYRILTAPHTFDPAVPPVPPSVSHSDDWVLWTYPDIYMMHGIQNAAGYDGFGFERYNQLAGRMKVWGELENPDQTLRGASREIDLLNVRYLLSMRTGSGAIEDASTRSPGSEVTSNRWRLLRRAARVDIYENTRALPRAWMAADTRVLRDSVMLTVIRTGKLPDGSEWDPLQVALVEAGPSNTSDSAPAAASKGSVDVTRYEANRVDLKTASPGPSILVLSENYYPGWRVYVDDETTDTLRVDYNLRGVRVPAGQHRVSFIYRSNSVLIGGAISAFMLVALGCRIRLRTRIRDPW